MLLNENFSIKITNTLNAQSLVSLNDHVSSKASPKVRLAQTKDEVVRKSSKSVKNSKVSISKAAGNASNKELEDLIKNLTEKSCSNVYDEVDFKFDCVVYPYTPLYN